MFWNQVLFKGNPIDKNPNQQDKLKAISIWHTAEFLIKWAFLIHLVQNLNWAGFFSTCPHMFITTPNMF
jgi:hypothetical protein